MKNILKDFKPVVKNSNFVHLWSSQVLSLVTINIMNFVLLTRLFEKTGSSLATSLLWIAYALPAILIGPFAAAIVDVFDRRKILIYSNLLQAATIFIFALSHKTSIFFAYGVVIIYSLLNQFYVPAESASLPSLLPKKLYTHANSLFFMTQQASLILGYASAGILLGLFGFEKTLFLCSAFVFLAFVNVIFLPKIKVSKENISLLEVDLIDFFKRIYVGYKFIKGNRNILVPFVLLLGFQVAVSIVTVNVPALARDILNINMNTAGLLIIVPAGLGALIAAFNLPKFIKKGLRKKKIIENSLFIATLSIFIMTFIIPEISSGFRVFLGLIICLVLGMAFIGITVPSQTFLQESTPKELYGRVFGNFSFMVTLATIFPVIFSGTITELFGIRMLFFLLGAFSLTALMFSRNLGQKFINNEKF
jgi:MFS family permease